MKKKSTFLKLRNCLLYTSLSIFLFSCGSKQDIVYFQDADLANISKSRNNYTPIIRPDDKLIITVSALDQDAVRPFNLTSVTFTADNGDIGRPTMQTYLVDSNGNVDFPVLGSLKLAGLNRMQATTLIKDLLKEYVINPIVNIRTINFKVTVLGEVRTPGSYIVSNERITILEALGLAGDMTIQAKRENVFLVREEVDGKKTYNRLDMTSEAIFNSPYYYLAQNDVIYVEPNNSRVRSSTVGPSTTTSLRLISTLVTVAALVVSLTR